MSIESKGRPRKTKPDNDPVKIENLYGESTDMNEVKLFVATINKKNVSIPEVGALSAADWEAIVAKRLAEGWTVLPGFPVFTGLEDIQDQKNAGFQMMVVFGK